MKADPGALPRRRRLRFPGGAPVWIAVTALLTLLVWKLVLTLALADAERIDGQLRNAGTGEDAWVATPISCALDPQDGRPPARSSTRLSLLWLDTSLEDPRRNEHWLAMADQPLRLDLVELRDGQSDASHIEGVLRTVKHNGPTLLDRGVCRQLALESRPSVTPNGGTALSGTLNLDCETLHGRLTGHLRFAVCGR